MAQLQFCTQTVQVLFVGMIETSPNGFDQHTRPNRRHGKKAQVNNTKANDFTKSQTLRKTDGFRSRWGRASDLGNA